MDSTPITEPEREAAQLAAATGRELAVAGAWNLSFNVLTKAQSVALLVSGVVVGGLGGVGIVSTAMAACYLGAAIADFGLSSELGRLCLTHPTRRAVDRCTRALLFQSPLAALIAPGVFYVTLGHRSGGTVLMLAAIALLATCLMGNVGLTAILNALGDFRTPATWLGSARLLSTILALAGAAIVRSPDVIIAAFMLAEVGGVLALTRVVLRTSAQLCSGGDRRPRLRRTHVWLGVSATLNVLTNQSDTILVASILSPQSLGLFSIASVLENGSATIALAPSTPLSLRAVSAAVNGRSAASLLARAVAVAAVAAAGVAGATWLSAQVLASHFSSLAPFATGRGMLVLGLGLGAAVPSALAAVCLGVAIGFGLHRAVGVAGILTGVVAIACVVVGARLFGVAGAAGATLVRDVIVLAAASTIIGLPSALRNRPRVTPLRRA